MCKKEEPASTASTEKLGMAAHTDNPSGGGGRRVGEERGGMAGRQAGDPQLVSLAKLPSSRPPALLHIPAQTNSLHVHVQINVIYLRNRKKLPS